MVIGLRLGVAHVPGVEAAAARPERYDGFLSGCGLSATPSPDSDERWCGQSRFDVPDVGPELILVWSVWDDAAEGVGVAVFEQGRAPEEV